MDFLTIIWAICLIVACVVAIWAICLIVACVVAIGISVKIVGRIEKKDPFYGRE